MPFRKTLNAINLQVTLRSQEEHEHKQAEHQQEATAAMAKSKFEDPTPACAICLSDFEPGELAMVFKKCGWGD
jgi:hypothetical protein